MTDKIPDVKYPDVTHIAIIQQHGELVYTFADKGGIKYYSAEHVEQLLARQREACAEAYRNTPVKFARYNKWVDEAILNARIEDE